MKRIYLRNVIGWHIKEEEVTNQLNELINSGESHVEIYVNSGGGSVFEGWALYNSLKALSHQNRGIKIDIYNIGIAASMASVLMLSVPRENRFAYKNSMYMIHNASTITWGDKRKHKGSGDLLEKIDGILAKEYSSVTGMEEDYIKVLMDKTTWLTAQECKELGFIGNVVEGENKEKAKILNFDAQDYMKNAPESCYNLVAFIGDNEGDIDLTKTTKSQIWERHGRTL